MALAISRWTTLTLTSTLRPSLSRIHRPFLIKRLRCISSLSEMSSSVEDTGAGKMTAPYGSWKSPITADVVSGAEKRLGGFALAGDGRLVWIESRPEEKGYPLCYFYIFLVFQMLFGVKTMATLVLVDCQLLSHLNFSRCYYQVNEIKSYPTIKKIN